MQSKSQELVSDEVRRAKSSHDICGKGWSLKIDLVLPFPRFSFPPPPPNVSKSKLKMKHLRHDIFLYISSFIKIQSPIHETNISQFSRFPFPPAPPPQMVKSGKRLLSSQLVQVPDTSTNFHPPSTSRSTEFATALGNPPPSTPQKPVDLI